MNKALMLLGASQVLVAQTAAQPSWVDHLPSAPGKVYASASALISPTEAMAKKVASDRAKAEVLARLRASVKATTDSRTQSTVNRTTGGPATATATQNVDQAITIQTQTLELPGLAVEATWTDRKDNHVWALAYLDVGLAERDLRNRFDALQNDLAGQEASGAPRERIRKLQRLREAQAEMAKLDDTAGLISAGGGDPALRAEVRKVKLWVDKLLDQLRASLTFSIGGDDLQGLGGDVSSLLRNAVLKQGLGWAERNGEFTLVLKLKGEQLGLDVRSQRVWWQQSTRNDVCVARAILEVTLVDRAGTPYETMVLDGKGVHPSQMMADKKLLDDLKAKLEVTLGQWLKDLTK